jgi:hypothetical protein
LWQKACQNVSPTTFGGFVRRVLPKQLSRLHNRHEFEPRFDSGHRMATLVEDPPARLDAGALLWECGIDPETPGGAAVALFAFHGLAATQSVAEAFGVWRSPVAPSGNEADAAAAHASAGWDGAAGAHSCRPSRATDNARWVISDFLARAIICRFARATAEGSVLPCCGAGPAREPASGHERGARG